MSNGETSFRSFELEGDEVTDEQALAISALSVQLGLRVRETTPGRHEITSQELASASLEMFGNPKYGVFAADFLEAMRAGTSIDLRIGYEGRLQAEFYDNPILPMHAPTVGNLKSTSQEATARLRKDLDDNKIFLPFEVQVICAQLSSDDDLPEPPAISKIVALPITDGSLRAFLEVMNFDQKTYKGFTGKTIATMQKVVGLIDRPSIELELIESFDKMYPLSEVIVHMQSSYGGSKTMYENFYKKLEEDIIGQLTLRVPEARLFSFVGLEVEGELSVTGDGKGLDLSGLTVSQRTLEQMAATYINNQSALPNMLMLTLRDLRSKVRAKRT